MPAAPTMAASMALLRQRSPVLWTAKRCRSVTTAPYMSRWRTMPFTLMNDEITSLYDACLVAIMPAGWSSSAFFRKQATSAYQRARIGDPQFLPPDFLKTYDIQ